MHGGSTYQKCLRRTEITIENINVKASKSGNVYHLDIDDVIFLCFVRATCQTK